MEVVVASGKGGTGKTFLASNLSFYLKKEFGDVVAADADVEAPDLLVSLGGARQLFWKEDFYGTLRPIIDLESCVRCWRCVEACEYRAIFKGGNGPVIDYDKCEGLGTCALVCPVEAIGLEKTHTGIIYAAESNMGIPVVTGDLDLGQGSSGRLVYVLKEKAFKLALSKGAKYRVIDAAPGIGCPVISSIAGSDLLVVVVEPTPQSVKGAERLLKVSEILKVKAVAVVNKYDLNPNFARSLSKRLKVEVAGLIPYDDAVIKSYSSMVPLLEFRPDSKAAKATREVLNYIVEGWFK